MTDPGPPPTEEDTVDLGAGGGISASPAPAPAGVADSPRPPPLRPEGDGCPTGDDCGSGCARSEEGSSLSAPEEVRERREERRGVDAGEDMVDL